MYSFVGLRFRLFRVRQFSKSPGIFALRISYQIARAAVFQAILALYLLQDY
jgi:hypothetical protein